jgi:A/G-specific adenine glycosylase
MQTTILQRYEENKRDLPRRQTTNPYKIRVSEVMSQQTQVSRVIPKYEARLDKVPTIEDLAVVDKHTLLSLWSGLGYNNRALRLQAAAKIIVTEHGGSMPVDEKALLNLPGIGAYTSHAIVAFAHNKEVPVIDINIKRVLITLLHLSPQIKEKELRDIAIACIPPGESRLWHNALMDYGALVLTAKKTGIKSAKQSKFVGSSRRVR